MLCASLGGLSFLRFRQALCDAPSNLFRSATEWAVVEMRISRGSSCLSVTQQSADNRQAQSATSTNAGIGMPRIVNANAGQTSPLDHGIPRALQIVPGLLRIVARHHVGADAL